MARILMLPTYLEGRGGLNVASARLRAYWVAKAWSDCDFYNGTQQVRDYDALIFQKLYLDSRWPLEAQLARSRGQKVYFDLCDPVWEQGARGRLLGMLAFCNAAVASTDPIRDYLARWLPAVTIGDYVDLTEYPACYILGPKSPAQQAVWFGHSANYSAVVEFLPELEKRGIGLTTISDVPLPIQGVGFIKWTRETVNQNLAGFDFVVNPKGTASRWTYKSDNKTKQAWSVGCPVACTAWDLDHFMDYDARLNEHARIEETRGELDVKNAVNLWKQVIEKGER